MPWGRLDDRARGNAKLRAVGKSVRGAMLMVWAFVAEQRTDGWVPDWVVRQELTTAELKTATTVKANGRAPLLHAPGDECDCLPSGGWPAELGGFWVHDWLALNPSRAENTVHRAKRRELADKDLRYLIHRRDGNACRYCGQVVPWNDKRSARALTIDHVDPTRAAGADNLVIACTRCNSAKRDAAAPEAAGLKLLPPPVDGTVPVDGWPKGTDPASIQRAPIADPSTDPTGDRIADPTAIEPRSDRRSTTDRTADPAPGDTPARNRRKSGAGLGERTARTSRGQPPTPEPPGKGGDGSGARSSPGPHAGDVGPAGRRPTVGPATTPRSAANPPIYRKGATSNLPPHHNQHEEEGGQHAPAP